jgi:hypothetical protein
MKRKPEPIGMVCPLGLEFVRHLGKIEASELRTLVIDIQVKFGTVFVVHGFDKVQIRIFK